MPDSHANLRRIFAHQSVEAARNRRRAKAAEAGGDPTRAGLFRALAAGQTVHAQKILLLLESGGDQASPADVAETLAALVDELQDMVMTAASDRDAAAESTLLHVMKASMNHRSKAAAEPAARYLVCSICGLLAPNQPPERCPVCRAAAELFQAVEG